MSESSACITSSQDATLAVSKPERTSMNDDETSSTSITLDDSSWNHDDSTEDDDEDANDDDGSIIHRRSSSSNASSPASPKSSRSVTFTTVTVREYPRCLGDNVTTNGAPISIEWKHDSEESYDAVEFDEAAESGRRDKSELKMPSEVRFHLLVDELGYSRKDIQVAIRQNNVSKSQRQRTLQSLDSNKKGPANGFLKKGNRLFKSLISKPAAASKRKSCTF
ncbi:MAG: hypothetical protein SGILL_001941 [Bacillariaceae sp.]